MWRGVRGIGAELGEIYHFLIYVSKTVSFLVYQKSITTDLRTTGATGRIRTRANSVPSPTIVKMVPIPTVATTSKATPTPRKKDTKGTQTEIRGCEVGTLGEILTLLRQNQGLSFTDIPRAPQHCQCQYCGKFGHTASVCRTRLRLGQ